MPSELANRTIQLLSPSMGDFVSRSTVNDACIFVKADLETLDRTKLIPFSERLEFKLSPALGPKIARTIKEKVQALDTREDIKIHEGIDAEINTFLQENVLPNEKDITDYAKFLSMKYGGEKRSVEKELIEKVKVHVRDAINKRKLSEDINAFLIRFPEPNETDIVDFMKYLHILNLSFKDDEFRELIEKERLFIKFHGNHEEGSTELDNFMGFVKINTDKETVGKAMKNNGLSYLISDESGISDQSLSEFISLITPNEEDMKSVLDDLGLDHMAGTK